MDRSLLHDPLDHPSDHAWNKVPHTLEEQQIMTHRKLLTQFFWPKIYHEVSQQVRPMLICSTHRSSVRSLLHMHTTHSQACVSPRSKVWSSASTRPARSTTYGIAVLNEVQYWNDAQTKLNEAIHDIGQGWRSQLQPSKASALTH